MTIAECELVVLHSCRGGVIRANAGHAFGRGRAHIRIFSSSSRCRKWGGNVDAAWCISAGTCAKFLRQSFHEWAGQSIAHSVWARAYYQQQRERGNDHHAAVRALAFKWIRIVFRCWQDRVAYDENKYLAALARRGSPLSSVLLAATAPTV